MLPDPEALAQPLPAADHAVHEAAAWRLHANTCALNILLSEALARGATRGASAAPTKGGGSAAASGLGALVAAASQAATSETGGSAADQALSGLLAAWGPGGSKLPALLASAAQLGLELVPLAQLEAATQAAYLQLGASALAGGWACWLRRSGANPNHVSSNSCSVVQCKCCQRAPVCDIQLDNTCLHAPPLHLQTHGARRAQLTAWQLPSSCVLKPHRSSKPTAWAATASKSWGLPASCWLRGRMCLLAMLQAQAAAWRRR